jgi:hypothetical protein
LSAVPPASRVGMSFRVIVPQMARVLLLPETRVSLSLGVLVPRMSRVMVT